MIGMLNKRFAVMAAFAVAFVVAAMWIGGFAYTAAESPMCPTCKSVRLMPVKGVRGATQLMMCPECKNETERALHHCDKCGDDVLVCNMCQDASIKLKAASEGGEKAQAAAESPMCPTCKSVRLMPVKGVRGATQLMMCPECKNETERALHHCDKCGDDVLVCNMCQDASIKLKAAASEGGEKAKAAVEPPLCPTCKDVRLMPVKGVRGATQIMMCPECKNEAEQALHHCDKCGEDVLVCSSCQKASAKLKAETTKGE